jgi:L-Lysine epsilon oxidase N-terminal/L-lysine epsilon oxidase C-terminal domain
MPTARKRPTNASRSQRATRSTPRARLTAALGVTARLGARTEYRIYPSIGIARVGDCKDSFLIGPEAPGIVPSGPFRGADKGLKPQAARFRIYKVEIDANENETVTEEVEPNDANIKIEWSVTLANRKAAGFRIGDTLHRVPNPKLRNAGLDRAKLVITASGAITESRTRGPVLSGAIEFARPRTSGEKVTDIALATLQTDEKGRLLVVGGPGKSGSPLDAPAESFSDNDGWYDSVSDGPVSATLRIRGQPQPVVPAWVVITVPRYVPGIYGIVTWYDQAVNMARITTEGRFNRPRSTSFTRDIYPILRRTDALSGVHGVAHSIGAPALSDAARIATFANAGARAAVLSKLTPIGDAAPGPEKLPPSKMPKLFSGANPDPDPAAPTFTYLALTNYQMANMENWVRGNFDDDWPGHPPDPVPLEDIPVARQAWALCEAALEGCVGGSFYPGIEGTYDIARAATYHPEPHLRREFRIDPAHPAGFLTEKMALPWQADFADCSDHWWPSQRPDDVTTDSGDSERWDRGIAGPTRNRHLNMVAFWSQLGMVVFDPVTNKFIETERTFGTVVA